MLNQIKNQIEVNKMLVIKSILLLFIIFFIQGCGVELPKESNSASIRLENPLFHSKPGFNRAIESENETIPAELTQLIFTLTTLDGNVISQYDGLDELEVIEFKVLPDLTYQLTGEAKVGEEILYSGSETITAMRPREVRSVSISLLSQLQLALNLQTDNEQAEKPSQVKVAVGSSDKTQFELDLDGLQNKTVIWYVNDIEGGNEIVGKIDNEGNYTPPSYLPENAIIQLRVTPEIAPSFSATIEVELFTDQDEKPIVNEAPTITSDEQFSINENETIVSTIQATDNENTSLTFNISGGADGSLFSLNDSTGELAFNNAPDFEVPNDTDSNNIYELEIEVSDGDKLTQQALQITVMDVDETPPANRSPIANAGPDQSTEAGDAITLNAENSSDPDGDTLTYQWSAPNDITLDIPNETKPTFTIPTNIAIGPLSITLIVSDGNGGTSEPDTVLITITPTLTSDALVLITDPALAQCIRDTQKTRVSEITDLNCEGNNVNQLDGLENFTALTSLDLSHNFLSDISPLKNLTALTILDLEKNLITNAHELENLTSLTSLNITDNGRSTDYSFLNNLTALTFLGLGSVNLTEAPELNNLTSLVELDLQENELTDISSLSNLTSLEILLLSRNQLTDISALANLTSLLDLELAYNQLTDISALGNLSSLTELDLNNNQLSDISILSDLTSLQFLELADNQLADISALSNLVALIDLNININLNISCSDLATLDYQFDSNDGKDSGIIQWSTCKEPQSDNQAPIANAGGDLFVEAGDTVTLGGGFSSDPDGDSLTYQWSAPNGIALSNPSELATTVTIPADAATGPITITLIVNDGKGGISAPDTMVVNVISTLDDALSQIVDPSLAQCIRDQQKTRISEVNRLSCGFQSIKQLKGLELFIFITRLELGHNQLTVVPELSKLTRLTNLYLNNNQLTHVPELSNLVVLTDLILHNNKLTDISGIQNLAALTTLHLYDNLLADISALSNLGTLTSLNLSLNQLTDISALSDLTALTTLSLSSNQLSDISELSNLESLRVLSLGSNQLTDISALSNLGSLIGLSLDSNQLTDISALSNLGSLTGLSLDSNQLTDISALSNLESLTDLSLDSNQLTDISALSNLSALTGLDLDNNQLTDISPLSNLTALDDLDLRRNQLSDITPLINLTALEYLYLGRNQLTEISTLSNLTALIELYLNNNELTEVSGLSNLTDLDELILDNNPDLLCISLETLDSQLDSSDGKDDGIVMWLTCKSQQTNLLVSNAGLDQTITIGETTTLTGTNDGAFNNSLSYNWEIVIAPTNSTATPTSFDTATIEFTPDIIGNYTIEFTIGDGISTSTDTIQIQVNSTVLIEPEMVAIPGGTFQMGDETNSNDNELPVHIVTIAPFEMGKFEVTFNEYDHYLQSRGILTTDITTINNEGYDFGFGRNNRPVISVSWDDIQGYLEWLNTQLGIALDDPKRFRLPSESEWEYAARAGTTTTFNTGDCINTDQANYDGNSNYSYTKVDGSLVNCPVTNIILDQTEPVGSYDSNLFGLFDMHGNVFEWVEDCWHVDFIGSPENGTPWLGENSGNCSERVLRSGFWNGAPSFLRSAYRGSADASVYRTAIYGFRLARTL